VDGEPIRMSSRVYAASRRAPRRRVQRRVGPSRIRWDRVGRIALVLVLFGVLVSYLNPLVNLVEAWQGSKSSEQQLTQLKQEQTQLRGQLREVSSPATLEREARRLGMVEPGEHAYVVHGLGDN
jgi:cell division protein FtsB